jgi:hypothetical protein
MIGLTARASGRYRLVPSAMWLSEPRFTWDQLSETGGMGQVYRATDTNLKRSVAIKVLPEAVAKDASRLARFQREAEALAALNHPHVAQIYGPRDDIWPHGARDGVRRKAHAHGAHRSRWARGRRRGRDRDADCRGAGGRTQTRHHPP